MRWLVGAILVVAVAGCSLLPGPPVHIDEGLAPRLSPDQVGTAALARIHAMEQSAGHVVRPARILSIAATTSDGLARLDPDLGFGQPIAPGILWLVKAEGTFTNNRTPPGGDPAAEGTGYFVYSDADGSVVLFGFP
jgi:hypothetical protein